MPSLCPNNRETFRIRVCTAVILAAIVAHGACRGVAAASEPTTALEGEWLGAALDEIERIEYHVTRAEAGPQAPNRAHDLRTHFRPGGIDVVPRRADASAWRFAWRSARWGRPGNLRELAPVAPVCDGPRVAYERAGITEWYENRPEGIEQGFTLEQRPCGEGPIRVEGRIAHGLHARLDTRVDAVDFYTTQGGVHVLRYEKLQVWDAAGDMLPAHLTLDENLLAIVVNDEAARYPITIDPIFITPDWSIVEPQPASDFGSSVGTAGDVNGDGFSDVIVGAKTYDAGETDEGQAFVFLGSATGLSTTPAWTFAGGQAEAFCGFWVGTAGDVNGDGYDDVLVGAFGYDDTEVDEGRAFLFQGSPGGLSNSPDWTMDGEQAGALYGYATTTAGDVNGDGYADVVITALSYDGGQAGEGRAYVYLGSSSGLAASPVWTAEGDQVDARFGVSAGTAGDVNADGFGDLIVGAYWYDGGQVNEGRVFVYHGSPSGPSSTADWIEDSNWTDANFGRSVGTAGDVNGDGYSDVVIGAPTYTNGQTFEGRVYVYLGSALGLEPSPVFTAETNQAGAQLGRAVGTAGDVDGDGRAEVVAGAPRFDVLETDDGIAYVYKWQDAGGMLQIWAGSSFDPGGRFGEAVGTTGDTNGDGYAEIIVGARGAGRASVYHGFAGTLSAAAATPEGGIAGAHFGNSVAMAGDVNGDGYSDVIVGAQGFNSGRGRALLFHGAATGVSGLPAWSVEGETSFTYLGTSVAGAGDVNGDGYADVIVGAKAYENGQTDEGAAFVYHGSPGGLEPTPSWQVESDFVGALFGWSVAGAGDVNGDGYADVIVGAPFFGPGGSWEGAAYVYLGSASGLEAEEAWSLEGALNGFLLGYSVGSAGDVNGDGYSDVILGLPGYSNGQSSEGAAIVFRGSPEGLAASPDWLSESDHSAALYGVSVSTAGDVNGDGYSDVVIGAIQFENPDLHEGMAAVFHGSAGGLSSVAAWENEGNQAFARYGAAVASAGDINGDGYSDVIVGAPTYTPALVEEGKAFVYLGSASGLSPNYDVASRLEGDQEGERLGDAVSTAGDVNGDGFSDVIVGAPNFGTFQNDEGRAVVYLGNKGDGLDRRARQVRSDGSAPIAPLGLSDSPTSFLLKTMGRSPGGRDAVRLQCEVKPTGVPFDGTGLVTGLAADSGPAGLGADLTEIVTGLMPNASYRWRLRILASSPFFPRSPWLSMSDNAATEMDLRMPMLVATEEAETPVATQRLAPPSPNPFRTSMSTAFTLQQAAVVRVAVYDVAGREVVRLADGPHRSGRHGIRWDGRNANGRRTAPGVYFLELDVDGVREVRKVGLIH